MLGLLSKVYEGVVRLRLFLYRHRFFRKVILGCPVISVGNITVGGTGKTPVVEMFAKALATGGRRVAILSRGYKKKRHLLHAGNSDSGPLIVSDGKVIRLNSAEAGDEPYMLARNLDGVAVIVDKNRVRGGSYAIEKLGVDILLLDDGFQYLPLEKTHEILLVDSTNPFGYGRLLPRGLLREPVREIARANFIFLTKTEKVPETETLKQTIRQTDPEAEVLECVHDPQFLKNIYTEEILPLDTLKSRDVSALSAIAVPEGFEDTLARLGCRIKLSFRYADHHRFSIRELKDIIRKTREHGLDTIITTEKDAVRIPPVPLQGARILYLRVQIKLVKGAADFHDFVHNICYY